MFNGASNGLRRFGMSLQKGSVDKALIYSASMGHEKRVAFLLASGVTPKTQASPPMKAPRPTGRAGTITPLVP